MGDTFDTVYVILLLAQFVLAAAVFTILTLVSAPYGKHSRKGWGLTIGSRWAWMLMELPAVFTILIVFILFNDGISPTPMVLLFLWEAHYIYRTFLYPSFFRGSKRNFPVLIVSFAFFFNIMNGFINGYFIAKRTWELSWMLSLPFILGTVLFIGGFMLHVNSDAKIRALRGKGETGYKLPHGGAFRFVSNPNYLGEIMEWIGWAVLTFSLPGLAFALFTLGNLLPRAISNHKWYKENFTELPPTRRIIIPYLF